MVFDRLLVLVTNFMLSLNVLFSACCFHIYIHPYEDKMLHIYADDTHLYWSVLARFSSTGTQHGKLWGGEDIKAWMNEWANFLLLNSDKAEMTDFILQHDDYSGKSETTFIQKL